MKGIERWTMFAVAVVTVAFLIFIGIASDPLTPAERRLGAMERSAVPPALLRSWTLARIEQRTLVGGGDLAMGAWSTRDDAGYREDCIPESPYVRLASCPRQVGRSAP